MKNLLLTLLAVIPVSVFASAPVILSSSIIATSTLCSNPESGLLYSFAASDADGDVLTIQNVVSSNTSVMDNGSLSFYTVNTIGNVYYFTIYGYPASVGTFNLNVTVSDGSQASSLMFPQITVFEPVAPQFTQSILKFCSQSGMTNLNSYVTIPGGSFNNYDAEVYFPNGDFDTDNSPLSAGDTTTLYYSIETGGCYLETSVPMVIYTSAYLGVEATNATCSQNIGTAVASLDAQPGTTLSWSTGLQNEETATGLASGSYSVSATTPDGCVTQKFFQVGLDGVTVDANVVQTSCFGTADGGLQLSTSGLTAPLSVLWSSGHSTINLSGVPAGHYTVNIHDGAGCHYSGTYEVTSPGQIEVYGSLTNPSCGSADGMIEVYQVSGGTENYSLAWSNGASGMNITGLAADIYTVTVTDAHGCIETENFYLSNIGAADIYGTVTPSDCGGATGSVVVDAYPQSGSIIEAVNWSNAAITLNIVDVPADNYVCRMLTSNNCLAVKGWSVPTVAPQQNNICVVTVDDATTTNLVVWEKVQLTGIDHYRIYRETSVPNYFALIDTVHADNESVFNDVVASPLERSWKYKISAVNTCNTEGPLSLPHQTIHLDVIDNVSTGGVTVGWNAYVGTGYQNFYLSRYTEQNGWEDIATLPASQLSYEDNLPITTLGLDYVVSIELSSPCTAEKAQDFNSSRSNKDRAQFNPGQGTGASHNRIAEEYLNAVTVSPNPASDKLVISQDDSAILDISIITSGGQVLSQRAIALQEEAIDISGLAPGVYIVRISFDGMLKNFRIVKI